ncbi:50S ribosomal protein L13 [Ehrlichia minasensis]|uniref:Large ribosomal subunit protein uL13 n=2 Tax=Ehrlichia minasensis TaxID=1242993 RepID=A0A4V2BQL7_9RICK|nr:50S ribosomal protein L13 [Ehrlichia minasensis]CEI84919.1 50S ribosomal protein L13 [Ehrlichia minasensis]
MQMETFSLKASQIKKRWVVIDASGVVVGRLAAFVANILRGKDKPEYTPHMDCGDNVIIINAEKVQFTGSKLKGKVYYKHTGYPGGLKSCTPADLLLNKHPERIINMAIRRMLSTGPMARRRLKNLYIYSGPEHKHSAQQPVKLDFLSMNAKNNKRR